MTVDGPQVDRPFCSAARPEDVEPRRSSDQGGPDCWRPQHVAAGGQASIPAIDNELRLGAGTELPEKGRETREAGQVRPARYCEHAPNDCGAVCLDRAKFGAKGKCHQHDGGAARRIQIGGKNAAAVLVPACHDHVRRFRRVVCTRRRREALTERWGWL